MSGTDPRSILSARFEGEGAARPTITARPQEVLETADAAQEWFLRLLLPLLTPAQRLQMTEAALVGVPQFLRAYEQIVEKSAPLRQALGIDERFVSDQRRIHGALLRVAEQAEGLHRLAEDGARLTVAEIRRALDALLAAADAIARDEGTDAAPRAQADRFAAFVRGYRARPHKSMKARQVRAERRVSRAKGEQAEALRELDLRRLRRDLLGAPVEGGEAPKVLPAPRRPPRRRVSGVSDPGAARGAPLSQCLGARPADFAACATDIEARRGALGIPALREEDRAALDQADALVECDLAVLVGDLLHGLGWLGEASGVASGALLDLADLHAALGRLSATAAQLAQGARDGAIVAARLVLVVHEQTSEWLRGRGDGDAEARRVRLLSEGAYQVLLESKERLEVPAERAAREVAAIAEQTAARMERADFERTLEAVRSDEEVSKERLEAAVAYKRRLEREVAQPGAPRRRQRPR